MSGCAQRTLLVAPTVEWAANLAESFDDADVTAPGSLEAVLAGSPGIRSVAVTGVPGDHLAAIAATVRRSCPPGSTLILDAALAGAVAGLSGFRTESVTQLGAQLCVCLQISDDATERPVLPLIRVAGPDPGRRRTAEAEAHLARVEVDRLSRRVAELETKPAARTGGPRRPASVAAAGVLAVAFSVVLALLTDTGYDGALLTVLVIVSGVQVLYAWRTNQRRAANDRKVRDTLRTIQAATDGLRGRRG